MKKRKIRYSELAGGRGEAGGGGGTRAEGRGTGGSAERLASVAERVGVAELVATEAAVPPGEAPVALAPGAVGTYAPPGDTAPAPQDGPAAGDLVEPTPVPRGRTLRLRAELRGGSAELLLFRVGAEMFGIELDAVEEVFDLPELHRVPEMPENMLGVFPLRGTLVPLYAPDATLGAGLRRPASALVFARGGRRLALAVDDVDDVLTLPLPALRDVPVTDAGDGVLAGVARRARDLIGVLDVDALLAQLRAAHALEAP